MATGYLFLNIASSLSDPWWLISFASMVPMIPVQQAAQRINETSPRLATEGRNNNYSSANIATIVIGGLLLVLVVVGTVIPE